MYCPNCSHPQVSCETRFCSRCGSPLVANIQMKRSKTDEIDLSPRQKGIRQGVMLILVSVILIPAYILLAALFPANDRLVESAVSDTPFEKISQAVLFTIFMLGLVRLLYARLFQKGAKVGGADSETHGFESKDPDSTYELPAGRSIPVSGFGSWRTDTGEMAPSGSARKHTTNSFDKK